MGITLRQFEELKQRVSGPKRSAVPVFEASNPVGQSKRHQVILGVDPSLRGTGFGVIRLARPTPQLLAQGTVKCSATWERSRCLVRIAEELRAVIKQHKPTICIIEALFYAQNLQTALLMGEARGASLLAASEAGLEIFELAPRKVKQAIVGYGAAQKSAVAKMVQRMLRLSEPPAPDAADALALALTHGQETSRFCLTAPKRL